MGPIETQFRPEKLDFQPSEPKPGSPGPPGLLSIIFGYLLYNPLIQIVATRVLG